MVVVHFKWHHFTSLGFIHTYQVVRNARAIYVCDETSKTDEFSSSCCACAMTTTVVNVLACIGSSACASHGRLHFCSWERHSSRTKANRKNVLSKIRTDASSSIDCFSDDAKYLSCQTGNHKILLYLLLYTREKFHVS